MNLRKRFVHPQFGCTYLLVKFRMDGKERATHCETKMMREATWAWAKAMPPLRRVRYLKQNIVSLKDGKHWCQRWKTLMEGQIYPTRPQSLPRSTTCQFPRPHRRPPQRSPSIGASWLFQFSKLGLFNSRLGLCQCWPRWQWCRRRQGTCRLMSRKPRCGTQCSRWD